MSKGDERRWKRTWLSNVISILECIGKIDFCEGRHVYWLLVEGKNTFEGDVAAIAEGIAFITGSEYGESGKV